MTTSRFRARALSVVAAAGLAVAGLAITATPSHAVTPTPFIVVGTSDVKDSNLMAAVIEPGFEKAYPQYDLQYKGSATNPAIVAAEGGTASALIVHAASVENQFVQGGYSLEKYGRAIFWGDFVLLGPNNDPAGVLNGASHDIVTAFEKIAAAGTAGGVTFDSRGNGPGTTIQEHQIWQLTSSSITKCDVAQADGLGQTPSTASGPCASPVVTPSWYQTNAGSTQSGNVTIANTCNASGGTGGCYVFTDRGTYEYMASQGETNNLQIVTRNNAAAARGGDTELVNSFHAYGINPAAVPANSPVDTTAAKDFLNYLTSPAAQQAVGNYLDADGDAPFKPSAAPRITITSQTVSTAAGKSVTVKGKVDNVVPGTPTLGGVPVDLKTGTTTVAATTTTPTGTFTVTYLPRTSQSYSVAVPAISKVENSTLNPIFGDLLQATSTPIGTIRLTGHDVTITSATKAGRRALRLHGLVLPTVTKHGAVLRLYAAHPGHRLKVVDSVRIPIGTSAFNERFVLGRGHWRYRLGYAAPGQAVVKTKVVRTVRLP